MPPNGHPETCCNARTSSAPDDAPKADVGEWAGEGYCRRAAGEGTDHNGEGRCRYHGGAHNGRPATHGLYSFKRERLREKLSAADGMESPGDLWTEVAVLRTLLSDYLEDVDEVDGDVLQDVSKIQKELRRTVDNIHEMMVRTRPTQEEVQRLINSFATILRNYVPEEDRTDALDELDRAVGDGRPAAIPSGNE
jgi:hypothetical protein